MESKLVYRIAIGLIKGVGPVLAKKLIAYFGDEEQVLKAKPKELESVQGIGSILAQSIAQADVMSRAEEELRFIERFNITPLFFTESNYPARLANCEDSPLMLYMKGNVDLNSAKVLSVVGTRKPTEKGKLLCEKFISDLAELHPNLVIVSGLAYGVDVCAHRQAVKVGLPTIGVVAHGLDMIYPSLHRDIAAQMVENGGLVTEFLSKTRPDAPNFVRRNRIIAGIADATLVVESGESGGSLITAHLAADYNRDVMAIPGSPEMLQSKGCNALIKKNIAALVESANDINYVVGWEPKSIASDAPVQKKLFPQLDSDEEKAIYASMLVERELTANELSLKCNIQVSRISAALLSMELAGLIKSLPGNAYRLI